MATSPREIKRRISSITNTKKITKAMEMVSAAKMRKSVERVQMSKLYAETAWDIAKRLSQNVTEKHDLAEVRNVRRVAIVVISGNKGLCGAFNRDVTNLAMEKAKEIEKAGAEVDFITCGKKCSITLASRNKNIVADFKKEDVTVSSAEVETLYKMLVKDFMDKKYDQVHMVYTDFHSTLKQVPTAIQVLPIMNELGKDLGNVGEDQKTVGVEQMERALVPIDYTFEPNSTAVLEQLYPRLLSIQLYQGFLESNACEHSARMMAMKNANEAAGEMVESLQLLYNRARQAKITQEIAEISAGRLALG